MSRIGKKPIDVPSTVTVTVEPEVVRVSGPRGNLEERKNRSIEVLQEDGQLLVKRPTDRAEHRALHGLTRSLVANMVEGVTNGFTKTLEIQGVGYRAQLKGRDLELALGYSHPVPIKAPEGIEFEVPQPTRVVVKGSSKQQVGLGPLDRGDRAPRIVVDELREHAPVGAEHRDARPLGAAAHTGADAAAALEAPCGRGHDGHARLPTFRATYSPS